METKTTKRKINAAIGVRKDVRDKFSKFCQARGLTIAHAAEQALTAWMRSQGESK